MTRDVSGTMVMNLTAMDPEDRARLKRHCEMVISARGSRHDEITDTELNAARETLAAIGEAERPARPRLLAGPLEDCPAAAYHDFDNDGETGTCNHCGGMVLWTDEDRCPACSHLLGAECGCSCCPGHVVVRGPAHAVEVLTAILAERQS